MTRAVPAATPGACCCRCGSTAATARCACPGRPPNPSSGIGLAVDHWTSAGVQPFDTQVDEDDSSVRYVLAVGADEPFVLEKSVSYAVGPGRPRTWPTTPKPASGRVAEIFAESARALPRLLDDERHRGGRTDRTPAGHPLEPVPAGPGHGLRRCRRHPGQGRQRLRLRRATTSGTRRCTCCPT